MPKKLSILEREFHSVDWGELFTDSITHHGLSYTALTLMVNSVPALLILATGPAAETWLAIVDNYHQAMALAPATPDTATTEGG